MNFVDSLHWELWGLALLVGFMSLVLLTLWIRITKAPRMTVRVVAFGVAMINLSALVRFLLSGVLADQALVSVFQWLVNATGLMSFSVLIHFGSTQGSQTPRRWLFRLCYAIASLLVSIDSVLTFVAGGFWLPILDKIVFVTTMALILVYGTVSLGFRSESGEALERIEVKRLYRNVAWALLAFYPLFIADLMADTRFPKSGFRWASVGLWSVVANLQFLAFFSRWVFHSVSRSVLPPPGLDWDRSRLSGLSEREWEIVVLSCRGLANKEIAWQLGIAVGTVKNHVFNIYKKARVKSRVELLGLFQQEKSVQ